MTSIASTQLALIIMALGIIGVILSFLVPDQKKSKISLGLAALVIFVGLLNLGSQSLSRFRWNRRMQGIQRDRQADLEALRQRLKDKTPETNGPTTPPDNKQKK
jgi:uncharacterized membrane protein